MNVSSSGRLSEFVVDLEFEQGFRAVIAGQVSPGIEYFSLLRPLKELAITQRFSEMHQYHGVFSSCNRNFHIDGARISGRWCGNCPKCRFTTLALAPFAEPAEPEGRALGGQCKMSGACHQWPGLALE